MANGPGRPKGLPKTGGGSRKGVLNKTTADLKAMILGALEARQGQVWLETQMDKNPAAFMSLLAKILPTQVNANVDGRIEVTTVRLVGPGET